jgi:hypothetical protein
LRCAVLVLAAAILAAEWIRVSVNPAGDLQNHREFARRLLNRTDLYAGGLDLPYTPFWAIAHIPAALLPARVMPGALFPVGVAALAALLVVLDRLCVDAWAANTRTAFWVAVGSVVLTSRFLLRDLLDAGQNVAIVAVTWAGILLWSRNRWRLAGASLGLAIALKLTPIAFVAYFGWKRQWRVVIWSLAVAMILTLTPAYWMGWLSLGDHLDLWTRTLAAASLHNDPRIGVMGLESAQNLSLRPALARFLMHIPAGADGQGRFEHPLNVDLLTLPPGVAAAVVRMLVTAAVAAGAFLTRRPLTSPRDPRAVWECAGVSVMVLLLSPITWRAHAVAVLPAVYLILRNAAVSGVVLRSGRIALSMLMVSSLILSRGVAGPIVSGLVHAYYLFTWTFLVLAFSMWSAADVTSLAACARVSD